MDIPEPKVHSFIVKLWLEQSGDRGKVTWRGYITHVPDGERCYLKTLSTTVDFIAHYLENAGDNPPPASRFRTWLRRLTFRTRKGLCLLIAASMLCNRYGL